MAEKLAPEPPTVAGERDTLLAFLDYYRSVVVRKVDGLDHEGLTMSPVESGTCLGGLIKHLAYVERRWFQARWAGLAVLFPPREEEFRVGEGEGADDLIEFYRTECGQSRDVISRASLDETRTTPRGETTMRWLLVHMIEETARHAGHADLIREMVDGSTGD